MKHTLIQIVSSAVAIALLAGMAGTVGYAIGHKPAPPQCAMEHIATAVQLIMEEGGDEDDITAIIESARHPVK